MRQTGKEKKRKWQEESEVILSSFKGIQANFKFGEELNKPWNPWAESPGFRLLEKLSTLGTLWCQQEQISLRYTSENSYAQVAANQKKAHLKDSKELKRFVLDIRWTEGPAVVRIHCMELFYFTSVSLSLSRLIKEGTSSSKCQRKWKGR